MSALGKNAKILCTIKSHPHIQAICDEHSQLSKTFKQRHDFIVKTHENLMNETRAEADAFFRKLEIALRAENLVAQDFASTRTQNLSWEPELGIIYTKDSSDSGHPLDFLRDLLS